MGSALNWRMMDCLNIVDYICSIPSRRVCFIRSLYFSFDEIYLPFSSARYKFGGYCFIHLVYWLIIYFRNDILSYSAAGVIDTGTKIYMVMIILLSGPIELKLDFANYWICNYRSGNWCCRKHFARACLEFIFRNPAGGSAFGCLAR